MKRYSLCILLIFLSYIGCKKGAWDRYMEFEPNRAPVIISFTGDFTSAPEPGDVVRIDCEASDPNKGDALTYTFSSDSGSFTGQTGTPAGSTVTFITGEITGGREVKVNVTVTDRKNASASQTLDLGRSRLGPVITCDAPLSTIGADGYTTITILSDSSGYYQVLLDASPILNHVRPLFALNKDEDVSIDICGPLYSGDKFIPGIPQLASTTEVQYVHILVVDKMDQYSYITIPLTSTGTTPNPGNGNPSLWTSDKTAIGFTLNWLPAYDAETEQSELEYSVYYSMNNNIISPEDAVINGTPLLDWTRNINNFTLAGLQSSQRYYFTVLVRDGDRISANYLCCAIDMDDNTPPVPGGSGNILISNVTDNSLTLTWERAEDEKSSQEDLKYKVVYSKNKNISTVLTIEAGLVLNEVFEITDWISDITTIDFDKSPVELSTYYYNVLVSDEAGNVSIYNMNMQTMANYWTHQTSANGFDNYLCRIIYSNGLFVTVGMNGEIQTSPDSIIWTKRLSDNYSNIFWGITYGNGIYVVVGQGGEIQTSTDGINWIHRTAANGYNNLFTKAAYENGKFIIVGLSGEIQTSLDGINWTHQTPDGEYSGKLDGITYGNGLYLIVGQKGEIQTSADCIKWTKRTSASGYNGDYASAEFANGQFIIVGSLGEIQTSQNGISWTKRTQANGFSSDFYGIHFYNDLFVAIGNFGEIQTSRDGINWTHKTPALEFSNAFWGITGGNGKFVIVGMNGEIQTSP